MPYRNVAWPEAAKLTCLIREAQKKQGRALELLLAALRPALVSYFVHRLNEDVADDLAQCALLRIAGALDRIDPERADGYVATVARNLLRTAYRRRMIDSRRLADVECLEVLDWREPPDRLTEYEELVRVVHRVADSALSPELADIIRGLLHGETTSEIAARQRVSPVTIRTRLLRARLVLRAELRDYVVNRLEERTSREHRRYPSRGEAGEASCGR
jgi:RNA polymerase sigma factor (sigma-70 family)